MARNLGCAISCPVSFGGMVTKCGVSAHSISKASSIRVSVDSCSEKGRQSRLQFIRDRSFRAELCRAFNRSLKTARSCRAEVTKDCVFPQSLYATNQSPNNGGVASEKWLERSLAQIVRHLSEAPFLQFVFSSGLLETAERFSVPELHINMSDSWKSLKGRFLNSSADGIILVQRLDRTLLSGCLLSGASALEELRLGLSSHSEDGSTDVWGVLVQGRGMQFSACYLLRTTRIASSFGTLTHFSLSRAKCFGPSIESQLQSTWLL